MSSKNRPKAALSSKLTKFRLALLYSFPAALFCSYYPLIHISESASTNYEFSLALIWLFFFALFSLKDALYYAYNTIKIFTKKRTFRTVLPLLALLFPLYLSATALWSSNPLRAVLTSGIFWCIIISAIGIIKLAQAKLINKAAFLKIFLLTSCVFCAFCWLQSLLDVLGVDRDITLLCPGCTSYSFGFPHPSGFAIEPQFMGNLLLAPVFLSLHLWLKSKSEKTVFSSRALLAISFFLLSTLFLTFSRGAIYSFLLGFALLLILNLTKLKNRHTLKIVPLVLVSFLLVLGCQGLASKYSNYSRGFTCGVTSAISQLSLGTVALDCDNPATSTQPTSPAQTTQSEQPSSAPIFSGYVEESTNARMNFNRIALELSPKTTKTLLFGYGLGSAGEIMYKEGKTTTPYEIVQNEPLSLLLETGLLGLLLLAFLLLAIFSQIAKINRTERLLFWAVFLAYACSLLFFSGLPNALHIYLFPVFLAIALPALPSVSKKS